MDSRRQKGRFCSDMARKVLILGQNRLKIRYYYELAIALLRIRLLHNDCVSGMLKLLDALEKSL